MTHRISSAVPFCDADGMTAAGVTVLVDGRPLDLQRSLRLVRHSPAGFAWGYRGSGPAQLALAILQVVCGDAVAVRCHQYFKEDYVAAWPQDEPLDYVVDVEAFADLVRS